MRLLLITNVFPNRFQPTKGTFNFEMVRGLAAEHCVEVVSPVSWVDRWAMKRNGNAGQGFENRYDVLDGIPVYYPTYYYTPKVLRRCYGWYMWRSVCGTILPLLRADSPDAILAYWTHPDGAVAIEAAQRIGKPCVVMAGGSDVLLLSKQAARRRHILGVLDRADAIVAVSRSIRAKLCELGVDPSKVHVIYRGVDRERFSPSDRQEARRRLGVALNRPLLLWVGRMVRVKGLDILIDACAILKARNVDFQVVLIGSGPLEKKLRAECLARNLQRHVTFAGAVMPSELPDWYRAADATVLPSRSEGIPNVLLESIACGTPFVASGVGGVQEIASPGIDRLVTPGSSTKLADALEQQLGAGLQGTQRRFNPESWASAGRRLMDVVQPLTNTHLRTASSLVRPRSVEKMSHSVSPWSWRQLARRVISAGLPRRLLIARGPAARPWVWLTFDDGPDPQYTPPLLDMLQANDVRATFFVIGAKAEQYPDLVRRMAREGHSVGHHTYSHKQADRWPIGEFMEEVRRSRELLRGLLGKPSSWFRPPTGTLTISSLWHLWRAGQQVVLWNTDPRDYLDAGASQLVHWFRAHPLQAGDIVLLHDNHPCATEALPEVIEEARARGLKFAPLAQLAACAHG